MNVRATSDNSLATKAQPATVALFVSDIHLSPALPATTQVFLSFLQKQAKQTQQLYLLGDVFEYWAGDDDAGDPYHRRIISALQEVHEAGVRVFWIGGNRDFLVGGCFAQATGLTLLPDPHVAEMANRRIVLTHGDAWCTDDAAYMAFRKQVRDPQWQQQFLGQPLARRKQIVEAMRMGSKEAQRGKSMEIMDVNTEAIADVFASCGAEVMIHGHTHRPALHRTTLEGRTRLRYVLPDWDCEAEPLRGGWLALTEDGELHRFNAQGQPVD